jgi:hypothetical protein
VKLEHGWFKGGCMVSDRALTDHRSWLLPYLWTTEPLITISQALHCCDWGGVDGKNRFKSRHKSPDMAMPAAASFE